MQRFLIYLGLTVLGILWTFVLNPSRPLADSSSMALFWSWYNILVLGLACYVCVEQPRGETSTLVFPSANHRGIEPALSDESAESRICITGNGQTPNRQMDGVVVRPGFVASTILRRAFR
jgi:hypothetical protein